MKITKEYLRRVIKEELERSLNEDEFATQGNESDFYQNSGVVRGHIENIISNLVNPASVGGNFRTSSGDNILYQKVKGTDSIVFTYSNGTKRATIDKTSLLNKFGLMNDFVAASKQYKAENPSQ